MHGNKWILNDTTIQFNLIDMYGKCGMLTICVETFREIYDSDKEKYYEEKSIWNAMIQLIVH